MTLIGCSKHKIVILGASLFAEEIADVLSDMEGYEVVGFVEGRDRKRCESKLLGLPIHWIDDIAPLRDSCRSVCAVGSTERKGFIEQAAAQGLRFVIVVHPSAQVSRTVEIGEGTIISRGVIIASHTRIGRHVVVNRGCLVGHHVNIGDYVTISPGSNISGKTNVGDSTFVGMGAIIIDGISVGSHSVVGAGSVVTRDIPDNVVAFGVPARVVRENSGGGL